MSLSKWNLLFFISLTLVSAPSHSRLTDDTEIQSNDATDVEEHAHGYGTRPPSPDYDPALPGGDGRGAKAYELSHGQGTRPPSPDYDPALPGGDGRGAKAYELSHGQGARPPSPDYDPALPGGDGRGAKAYELSENVTTCSEISESESRLACFLQNGPNSLENVSAQGQRDLLLLLREQSFYSQSQCWQEQGISEKLTCLLNESQSDIEPRQYVEINPDEQPVRTGGAGEAAL